MGVKSFMKKSFKLQILRKRKGKKQRSSIWVTGEYDDLRVYEIVQKFFWDQKNIHKMSLHKDNI